MRPAVFLLFLAGVATANLRHPGHDGGHGHDDCTLVAKGPGVDDAPQLLRAWQKCSKISIPHHTTLNISTRLNMTGGVNKHIELQGTIRINPDIPYWSGNGFPFAFQTQITAWLLGGKNIVLDGGGTLDGAGQAWYDAFASNSSLLRPIILTVFQARNVLVKDITMLNSPEWFNLVNEGKNVTYTKINIQASSNSSHRIANTDGWDIYRSDQVVIKDSIINNGDDCVSFKPNSTNILVSNLNCNGSHGISVGSLGQFAGMFDIVENVTAINVKMSNAQNGARIKCWAGAGVGSGIVKNITFENFSEIKVDNPVVIDQCYMTNATACSQFPSNTFIQDIVFKNISGTSSGATVANLACSPDGRCSNINVEDFNLSSPTGTPKYLCQNVVLTGNAAQFFPQCGRLKEKDARHLARDLIYALQFCHRNGIVHRDVHYQNVVVTPTSFQLTNFALATAFNPSERLTLACGTGYFSAPELLQAKPYIGPEIDVWGLGVMLYIAVCGNVPWDDEVIEEIHRQILSGHLPSFPSFVSKVNGGPRRIAAVMGELEAVSERKTYSDEESAVGSTSAYSVGEQIAKESGHAIQYRTCSWQKTAGLLFSEYICLAILSFPWSYSVLGLVPGVLVTIGVAASVQYTSLIVWKFCLKHPEVRDVCDIGRIIFGGSQWAYNFTAVMFILNNTFIQALHCLVGAKLLNTLSNSALCTIGFSAISAILCFIFTLPRTLNQLSGLGTFSAVTMGIAVLLAIIFSGVQSEPFGYIPGETPIVTKFPLPGTTFIAGKSFLDGCPYLTKISTLGMSAFLNISYTLIGQITIPSFIAEMKEPRDFPKALWAVTICEVVVFSLCGAIMYHYVGNQYITAPAFGSLQPTYKKIAFSFAIPTIVYLGSLYSSVTTRFIFFRIFRDSKHRHSNTLVGWAVWAGIIGLTWIAAFIIAEVIPFFSDMLSLMSSLFDCWFGFIYWGMAYLIIYPKEERWKGLRGFETMMNYFLIVFGVFMLVGGTYTSIQSIIDSYRASAYGTVFSCTSNAL
ncbi:Protein kinase domain-containing protein [Mycena indigotica]|uniref:galacturonan 1,4-alpha-galacturonidase n=1 Tax=Mycena indigotica TaxID=2126181 RepID=A0A8H6S978_9AGAR|nr:Protein kinase domain-containing protein [Mycena indigotica]KAF7294697.1 Protein kinase domain-containing protein [Mycena indigotica]